MTVPTLCQAQIRPFTNETTVMCESPHGHLDMHRGIALDYAYSGSKTVLRWYDDDRRTFRGEWEPCASSDCILPANHRGDHAT